MTMAAVGQSSTLDPDSGKLDTSEPLQVPSTAASISKAVERIEHEWHGNQAPLSEEAQAAFVSEFVVGLARESKLFEREQALLAVADFLGLDSLISALLASLRALLLSLSAHDSIELLRQCSDSLPPLPLLLAPKLGLDEDNTRALLEAVLACDGAATGDEKSAALTWVQLELCDAKHLVQIPFANPGLLAEETQELAAMPPKPMKKREYDGGGGGGGDDNNDDDEDDEDEDDDDDDDDDNDDVHDEANDPVAQRRKELETKRDAKFKVDTDACLGLFAWAREERARRQALTDVAAAASEAARETVGLLTAEQATELAELTAEEVKMPPKPTKKNPDGFGQDVYDEANDPAVERRKEVAARRKELEEKTAAARGALDGELAEAVKADDVAGAQAAFAKGAALDLHYVEGMRKGVNYDGAIPGDAAWLTANDLPESLDRCGTGGDGGESDALPLICFVADNIRMVNWLLDNGADVNARQPDVVDAGDYSRTYGGANVMVSASTLEAVKLLCTRGANTRYTFIQPTTASSFNEGCEDPTCELLTSDTQDGPIARCLVRHGAVVNTIYDPGMYELDFGSYWKNVVVSGDITWAAELLAKYGANADWPSKCGCDFECDYGRYEDGDQGDDFSTVLIIAVRKQDLPMVRLLLEHGADANKATPNFAEDSDEEDEDKPEETPLSVALETGNAPIIELLKSKGAKGE